MRSVVWLPAKPKAGYNSYPPTSKDETAFESFTDACEAHRKQLETHVNQELHQEPKESETWHDPPPPPPPQAAAAATVACGLAKVQLEGFKAGCDGERTSVCWRTATVKPGYNAYTPASKEEAEYTNYMSACVSVPDLVEKLTKVKVKEDECAESAAAPPPAPPAPVPLVCHLDKVALEANVDACLEDFCDSLLAPMVDSLTTYYGGEEVLEHVYDSTRGACGGCAEKEEALEAFLRVRHAAIDEKLRVCLARRARRLGPSGPGESWAREEASAAGARLAPKVLCHTAVRRVQQHHHHERNVGKHEADDVSAARAAVATRAEALEARAAAREEQLVAAVRAIAAPPRGVDTFPRTKATLYPLLQALLRAKRAAAAASGP